MVLLSIGALLLLAYAGLFLFYKIQWHRAPDYEPASQAPTDISFSIIIAARNEEAHIGHLLQALEWQLFANGSIIYPRGELVVVNDHSTDGTERILASFPWARVLQMPEGKGSKKAAIDLGIGASNGELIIATDADCLPGPQWLATMLSFYHKEQPAFMAAPVRFRAGKKLLSVFQTLDFLTLQGITAAGVSSGVHSLCNGANLAYTSQAFRGVRGFEGIDQVASGDDLLLMHKIRVQYPGGVRYLKSRAAILDTEPMPSWKQFFWQRIRWASKTRHYDDRKLFWALALVYLVNLLFPVLLVAGIWHRELWWAALIFLIIKTASELLFLYPVARFYGQQKLLWYFPFLQPLHIVYTVCIGAISQFGSYQWKGRQTK